MYKDASEGNIEKMGWDFLEIIMKLTNYFQPKVKGDFKDQPVDFTESRDMAP